MLSQLMCYMKKKKRNNTEINLSLCEMHEYRTIFSIPSLNQNFFVREKSHS